MKRNIMYLLILFIIIILLASYLPTTSVIAATVAYYMEIGDLPYNNKFITAVYSHKTNDILAIDEEGNIWAWGDNLYGIHGNGSTRGSKTPTKISTTAEFKQIDTNGYVSIAIDKQGNIWACGDNYNGGYACVGNGYELENYNNNRVITSFTQITSNVEFTKVCIGQNAVLALDKSGNIWGWGSNSTGVLLNEGKGNKEDPYSEYQYYQNIPKQLTNGKIYKDIDISGANAGAIDSNNNLYVWGSNLDCQLSESRDRYTYKTNENANFTITGSYEPILIGIKKFNKFVIGDTMHAIDTEGYLWTWGSIDMTGLRHSSITGASDYDSSAKCFYIPRKVDNNKYSDIYEGIGMRYALRADNSSGYPLVAWGTDVPSIMLGMDNEIILNVGNSEVPIALYKQDITIIPNTESNLAFDKNGDLWGWGFELCNEEGTLETVTAPTQITGSTQCTVIFIDRGTIVKTVTVDKGSSVIAPTLNRPGYSYIWDTNFNNVTEDLTVRAIWTANTNIPYKIEHYLRTTDTIVEGYLLEETEQEYGATDSTAIAIPKTYEGFTENTSHPDRVATGTITADGNLVLKLYYDRNKYNVIYELDGGNITVSLPFKYTYGKQYELVSENYVVKQGYKFAGWYDNSEFSGNTITNIPAGEVGDKTFYAKWEPSTETPYTVEYYKQNINLVDYDLVETKEQKGTTGQNIGVGGSGYQGFTLNNEKSIQSGEIKADGSLVLQLYYDRNTYNVILDSDGGTIKPGEEVTNYTYGIGVKLPVPTKQGYTFEGWYENSPLSTGRKDEIGNYEIGEKHLKAKWELSTETTYTIEYYKQNINLKDYDLVETKQEKGTTGQNIGVVGSGYQGFTLNNEKSIQSGELKADGSLVLQLYYDRDTYNVTLNPNGGIIKPEEEVTNYIHGIGKELPTPTKDGYVFVGWYDRNPLSSGKKDSISGNEIGDIILEARWEARTDTPYKIEHYLRTIDEEVEGYEKEVEEKQGITDSNITATSKIYQGFTENTSHPDRVPTGTITADGKLVLRLYYNRNKYNIRYELNGGTANTTLTSSYLYGKGINLSNKVRKTGYNFAGWYDNIECTGNPITSISQNEIGDKILYAKWVSEELYYITSEKYSISEKENHITKVSPNTTATDFINSISANGTKKLVNQNGQEVTGNTLVGTGYKLQVTYKGQTYEYEIAVRGDLDGNGKITVTDLSILNQILVRKLTVTGIREKAADLDYSGKVSITDLSMMNQAITKKITL